MKTVKQYNILFSMDTSSSLLSSEPSLPTASSSDSLESGINKRRQVIIIIITIIIITIIITIIIIIIKLFLVIRYLTGSEERGVVSYENINVDQINDLCVEGFTKVLLIIKSIGCLIFSIFCEINIDARLQLSELY